jgi:hypothetical protein
MAIFLRGTEKCASGQIPFEFSRRVRHQVACQERAFKIESRIFPQFQLETNPALMMHRPVFSGDSQPPP